MAGPHNIGKTVEVSSPLGEPPVFVRDVEAMHTVISRLKEGRIVRDGSSSKKKNKKSKKKSNGGGGGGSSNISKPSLLSSFRKKK